MTRRDAVVLVFIPLSDNLIPDKDGPLTTPRRLR